MLIIIIKLCIKLGNRILGCRIGHFTVMDGSEGEGDLVLIQTFFALLWKLFLKNTSKHKNNLIYIIKQEGLYQNKVTLSLASIHNCKMAYSAGVIEVRGSVSQFAPTIITQNWV